MVVQYLTMSLSMHMEDALLTDAIILQVFETAKTTHLTIRDLAFGVSKAAPIKTAPVAEIFVSDQDFSLRNYFHIHTLDLFFGGLHYQTPPVASHPHQLPHRTGSEPLPLAEGESRRPRQVAEGPACYRFRPP
ncbi:hypothetical protein SODALDRAFT_355411 [Sodiomyces alkalinus F11]|uniref:Uncharacterized protein n=1 Tax=Sodiomyces alkalinus (strain CBS 110278 / VKM F-3762 / F11) TaxID=1314773 RepID=A0A3N2Q8Z0_SODAK|nr:hypothetical protein SODALDRAFT_355411 [Sodiomyces alkalinus F11]ROT43210.1 hypothetical protein SODALDRAFT_355411 [Sodiomyces alkalinus F11]